MLLPDDILRFLLSREGLIVVCVSAKHTIAYIN
jgi:hypothetical protein